jgi:hypothetical protein
MKSQEIWLRHLDKVAVELKGRSRLSAGAGIRETAILMGIAYERLQAWARAHYPHASKSGRDAAIRQRIIQLQAKSRQLARRRSEV